MTNSNYNDTKLHIMAVIVPWYYWRNSYIHSGIVGPVQHDSNAEPDDSEGRVALGEGQDDEEDGGPDETDDRKRFPDSSPGSDLESI